MFDALNKAFLLELRDIKNSFYKLFLITIFPIMSFVLIISIFYSGITRDIPIAVVDNDKSKLSRSTLNAIEASPTVEILHNINSVKEATTLLQKSEVYAIVVIPNNFHKDIYLQKQPKITVLLNTQYILVGKILTSALSKTLSYNRAEIEFVQNLIDAQVSQKSLALVQPITLQVTPFFNTYQNYFLFLVSALLPSIWQIFIVIATIVSFGSLFKAKGEKEFFSSQYIELQIIGKLLPYTLSYLILGVGYLFYIYGTLGWEFQGSWAVMIFAMFLTVVAYQFMALLFFVTGFDYARTLSLGAVYTAPAFAFLGVTFPVESMNAFATFWRDLLPISHLIELQISQANYGGDIFLEVDNLSSIFMFWFVSIIVFLMFRRRLSR